MGNMSLTQIVVNATTLFTSQLGAGLILLGIIVTTIYSMFHGHWGWFYTALAASGIIVSASWIIQTVYGISV